MIFYLKNPTLFLTNKSHFRELYVRFLSVSLNYEKSFFFFFCRKKISKNGETNNFCTVLNFTENDPKWPERRKRTIHCCLIRIVETKNNIFTIHMLFFWWWYLYGTSFLANLKFYHLFWYSNNLLWLWFFSTKSHRKYWMSSCKEERERLVAGYHFNLA